MMTTRDAVQLPVLAGRWEYDTRVVFAAGNNAQTFAGKDLRSGEEIVVKIFNHAGGGLGRERFLREARLHEELEHEAILELLGRGPDDGVDYIVTRRLRPGALGDVVQGQSRLGPAATLAIGVRIADALAYMHGRGEVHGDISPGNILLDAKEDAYLADFGLSKRLATVAVATTGDGFGTRGFSLPREQGTRRTYEDDVYGLAAVLWFCLTGEPPPDSPRARRRELSSRALRAPLNKALGWESESIPSAEEFRKGLVKDWAKVGQDWRAVSSAPRRSRVPLAVAAGVVGLAAAGLGGQALQPMPAAAAQTTVSRSGVSLSLPGKWRSKPAPKLPEFHFRKPVAAFGKRGVVVAGRLPSAGPRLISADARASMLPGAQTPQPVTFGEYAALRYGPATKLGGAEEVLALPLAGSVLVIHCGGPAATLDKVCAEAAAGLELRDGSLQPLAPDASVSRRLRGAAKRLGEERQRYRSQLASAAGQSELAAAAAGLARADRAFATALAGLPTNAQDAAIIEAAAGAARAAAAAYADLARATTESAWGLAQAEVDQRERRLELAVDRLGTLPVYPS